jgi:hypothetical protein
MISGPAPCRSRSHKPAPSPSSNLAATTALQQCMNMTAAISSAALAIFAADTAIFQCVNEGFV